MKNQRQDLPLPVWDLFRPELRQQAEMFLKSRNIIGFLGSSYGNQCWLQVVAQNVKLLDSLGVYEEALLHAFTGCRVNNHNVSNGLLFCLFRRADRERLKAAGQPFPGHGPFTLYRGVAGKGRARRVRGYSWTSSLGLARRFAHRLSLYDPGVCSVQVEDSQVLAYLNHRQEEEFIVNPERIRPVRIE